MLAGDSSSAKISPKTVVTKSNPATPHRFTSCASCMIAVGAFIFGHQQAYLTSQLQVSRLAGANGSLGKSAAVNCHTLICHACIETISTNSLKLAAQVKITCASAGHPPPPGFCPYSLQENVTVPGLAVFCLC